MGVDHNYMADQNNISDQISGFDCISNKSETAKEAKEHTIHIWGAPT